MIGWGGVTVITMTRAAAGQSSVCSFAELTREQGSLAGGKGRTLSELSQAGYPVPAGFIVLMTAFQDDELRPEAWEQVRAALAKLRGDAAECAYAVRSSAQTEDSASASFAGGFETVLDVRDEQSVRDAIATVRKSRHASRVAAYSHAQGLLAAHDLAVIVQRLVAADFAGVLFTADPVTGSRTAMVGNYVRGLGDELVSGKVSGTSFTFEVPRGTYVGPAELRPLARSLYKLATRLERERGAPQDIEWAVASGRIALLQTRPITTLRADNPATGEWNDSLTGDCLWASTCFGEAVPDVMTPSTWSLLQFMHARTLPLVSLNGCRAIGNVGGRYYMNLSVFFSLNEAVGVNRKRFLELSEPSFGRFPEDLEIPLIPFPLLRVFAGNLPTLLRISWAARASRKRFAAFLAEAPGRCAALRTRIEAAATPAVLLALWRSELEPFFHECCLMLKAVDVPGNYAQELRRELTALVSEADASALLAGLSDGARHLDSLGPLLGLGQLFRGEIDRQTYAARYGHRGAHEFEISIPRPAEEPDWLDRQLAGLKQAPLDVTAQLARRQEEHEAAWERLRNRHPRKATSIRRQLDQIAKEARNREAARSEAIRAFWALRAFFQRAGALTGQGEATFFLSLVELLAVLDGDDSALAWVPARRATHARYCALPRYPALIRGRFDPLKWAADPLRRSDIFNARGHSSPAGDAITGFPGAVGIVQGRARVLHTIEDGDALQTGEILVTTTTNVGWTLLFPRAAAVVTDIGAPLSHAAIVARELGIPAVVGCGNATVRIRTGDLVRVDGAQGTVEVLEASKGLPQGGAENPPPRL
jgi:pyruvate,water dikinase